MTLKTHKFHDSLQVGDAGEALFSDANPSFQKQDKKSHTDFICSDSGDSLELKTDTYPMDKTENFFIERYSSDKTMLPGGPYRNLKTTHWVYYFISDDVAFWFNPQELVTLIHKLGLDNEKKLTRVYNRSYATLGWKIPRRDVEHIARQTSFAKRKKVSRRNSPKKDS